MRITVYLLAVIGMLTTMLFVSLTRDTSAPTIVPTITETIVSKPVIDETIQPNTSLRWEVELELSARTQIVAGLNWWGPGAKTSPNNIKSVVRVEVMERGEITAKSIAPWQPIFLGEGKHKIIFTFTLLPDSVPLNKVVFAPTIGQVLTPQPVYSPEQEIY